MPTANMNLTLPTPTVTLGPAYATQNNTAFETIDAHDHTSGKGLKVPTAGLNINAHLNFNTNYKAYNLYSAQLVNQAVALSGAGNALSLSTTSGDLYYTNGAGNSVQITSGGAVIVAPGTFTAWEPVAVNTNLTIGPADTFVILEVDTTAARTINLPLAANVANGRIYIIKDITGTANTNPITVQRQGADTYDGATSKIIDSNYGSQMVFGDGSSKWSEI
jgi:hypothetical protein